MRILRLLFGFSLPVNRKTYAVAGFALMALKLSGDQAILYAGTGRWWSPLEYLSLISASEEVPNWALRELMLWALPFAWIGLSMTVRRAVDAGQSARYGLLFCIPVVNFVVMLAFCLVPSKPASEEPDQEPPPDSIFHSEWAAIGAAVLVAMVATGTSMMAMGNFGGVLFVGTPLGMGVVAGYVANAARPRSLGVTLRVAFAALVMAVTLLLLFAIEGVLCIAMILPMAAPLILIGALFGRAMTRVTPRRQSPVLMVLLVLPLLAWVEPTWQQTRLHEVVTQIEIDAPPEVVWQHVTSFSELAPPEELWFRLGVAHPTRARIDGAGVGAVRTCEFSTGAFVEPITVWDPPRTLGFDVASQPGPLRELSPYARVFADHHLHGTITSRRGQFQLAATANGGTLLEGTTWYELSIYPEAYWSLWSDHLIHTIHLRVLQHIAGEATAEARG